MFIKITSFRQLWYGAIFTEPSASSVFLETSASFWHGRARKEMDSDEWTFNESRNIEKSMKETKFNLL